MYYEHGPLMDVWAQYWNILPLGDMTMYLSWNLIQITRIILGDRSNGYGYLFEKEIVDGLSDLSWRYLYNDKC